MGGSITIESSHPITNTDLIVVITKVFILRISSDYVDLIIAPGTISP